MNFFDVLAEMLVILFAIAAGYAANHLGYLGGEMDQKLSKLILNITMPAMIVAAVITGEELPEISVILSILEVGVVFYVLEFAFVLTVPKLLPGTAGQKGVYRYTLAFPNVGFIGYPVAVALYGDGALFYAAILALPFNLLSYSLGPLMLAGAGRFRWRQLLSPCIVASVLGLVLALTRLRPPAMVGEMLDFVGSITVPLSLLVVGSLLAHMSPGKVLRSPKLWVLSVLRLLVMPALLCLVLRGMHIEAMVLGIAVSQMGMPVAVNGTLLSMEYGGDTEAMAQVTFLTTLGAIVTIPVLAAVLL
nr:AEC family transporter [uncultured Oscillibacter sp.]